MVIINKVIEKNMFFGAKSELFALALQMRKNPTEAERAMWNILRKFVIQDFHFADNIQLNSILLTFIVII